MSGVTAVIPAAGFGLRLKKRIPKALIKLNNKPIFIHTLSKLSNHPGINEIILLTPVDHLAIFKRKVRQYRIKKVSVIVSGGATRRESVEKGLALLGSKSSLVLIHDAARPFIERKIISQAIKEAKKSAACIVAVPVKPTIKRGIKSYAVPVGFEVKETIDRADLWEAQTPQVFKKELIVKAYKQFKSQGFTDDASLVERSGVKVKIVKGSYLNIKITTPEDLVLAKAIIQK